MMGPQLWAAVLTELGYDVMKARVPRLKCLAARVAASLANCRGLLPAELEVCVSLH